MDKTFEKLHEIKLEKCIKKSKTSKCVGTLNFLYFRHQNTFVFAFCKLPKGK